MAQTVILALDQTPDTSDLIEIASGTTKTVGLFSTAVIPFPVELSILMTTPEDDIFVGKLTQQNPTTVLVGPGTYLVDRKDISVYGVGVGVFVDA